MANMSGKKGDRNRAKNVVMYTRRDALKHKKLTLSHWIYV